MKLLIAFGLLATAIASYNAPNRFQAGKEYHFNWNGQISSGLHHDLSASQYSVQQINANVTLSFSEDDIVWLRLSDIRLSFGQKHLRDPRVFQKLELDDAGIKPQQLSKLKLLMSFRYHNGLVTELQFDSADQAWSHNIKRSFLNLIQVNIFNSVNDKKISGPNDFFITQERTLEGDCEVAYTITKGDLQNLDITKSLNFDKCSRRFDTRYNFRFGEQLPEGVRTKDRNPDSQTVINYNITKSTTTGGDFLINEVDLRSEYVFAPLNKEQQFLATYVHQKLRLVDITDTVRLLEEPELGEKRSMLFDAHIGVVLEKFWQTGDDQDLKKVGLSMTDKVEAAVQGIKRLLKYTEDGEYSAIPIEASMEMDRLTWNLRFLNKTDIQNLYKNIEGRNLDEKTTATIQEILVDALATAGTRATLSHVFEKIQAGAIGTIKAAHLLKKMVITRIPSREIIDDLLQLCDSEVSRKSGLIKQSCWLTAGALINGICGDEQDTWSQETEHFKKCTGDMKANYVRVVKREFEKAESNYEKILALKVLANAGIDLSVYFLETIIYDKEQERSIRKEGIEALRQLRLQMPRRIQQLLMPLFKSRSEDPEIRMSAVFHIMNTLPERVVIEQIIEQINKERNQQVASFTYSLIKSFVRSENPYEKKLSEDCEVALRMLTNKVELSSQHSRHPVHSSFFNTGSTAEFSTIYSNQTILPKELFATLEVVFGESWSRNFAQIGITQQNLETIIFKVLEGLEVSETPKNREKKTATLSVEYLRSLAKKMNIRSRSSDSAAPQAMVFMRYLNLDYAVLPIDEKTISELLKMIFHNGKVDVSEMKRLLSSGYHFSTVTSNYLYESNRLISTSYGFAMMAVSKVPSVASFKGLVKPSFEKDSSGMKIRIRANPTVTTSYISEVTILSPLPHTGALITHSAQLSWPIDTNVMMIYKKKKLHLKATVGMPEVEKRLLLIQTRPATFVKHNVHKLSDRIDLQTIHSNKLEKKSIDFERSYGEEFSGLQMNVFGSVHRHMLEQDSVEALLLGENHVELSIKPTDKAARELVFEVETGLEEYDHSMSAPRFENFADSELLAVDGLEEKDSEMETGRRTAFDKYYKNLYVKGSYKNVVAMKAYTVGAPDERKVQMDFQSVCEKTLRYCKMDVLAKRSPLIGESREWELKASVDTLFPAMPNTLQQMKEQKHREFQAVVASEWGSDKKSVLKMKIQGAQDRTLQKLMKYMNWGDKKGGFDKYEKLQKVATLNQYKLLADYELEPTTKMFVEQIYNYVQSYVLPVSEIKPLFKHQDRVYVKLSVEPESRRYVNLTVETPSERIQLRGLRLPVRVPLLNIAKNTKVHQLRALPHSTVCEVMSSKVRTFDKLLYKTPLTTCYSVIAKDCSEHPMFAVLLKKLNNGEEEKKMKIISEDNVIECALVDEKIVCSLNGNVITDDISLDKIDIEKINEDLYQIVLHQITVRFDGYTAKVQMSSQMQNRQCGLCGHFDGQNDNDFRGAGNIENEDVEEFHRSWMVRDSECAIDEAVVSEKKNYGVLEDGFSSETTAENDVINRNDNGDELYEPRQKTVVVHRGQKTCFSMETVPECERNYKSEATDKKKVAFTCLPKHDRETMKLTKRARTQTLDLSEYDVSFTKHIPVPSMCLAH